MDPIEQPVHSVLADAATGCRAGHDGGVVPRPAAVAAGVFGVTPGYDPAEINTTELPDVVGTASIPSAVLEPEVKDNAYVTPPSLGPDAGSAGAGNGYVVPVSDSHSHTVDATAMVRMRGIRFGSSVDTLVFIERPDRVRYQLDCCCALHAGREHCTRSCSRRREEIGRGQCISNINNGYALCSAEHLIH